MNELEVGTDSRRCGGWSVAGQERVGGECDFLMPTGKRGVEELEEASETEQWVGAAFRGEGDGGSPFENVAVVVRDLQEDFRVSNRHGLTGGTLSVSGRSVGEVDAKGESGIVLKHSVVRAGVEQAPVGS